MYEQAVAAILATIPEPAGRPALVGIAGPPGSGKSTLARESIARIPDSVLVPMDGFHLSNRQLAEQGLAAVKGAPQTFDRNGLLAGLRRLGEPEAVYFPDFSHERHEPIAASVRVDPGTRVVVVEGNYLLLDSPGWREIHELLDVTVFIDIAWSTCRERLIPRHEWAGKTGAQAKEWVDRSDRANYDLVMAARLSADIVLGP